jgi:8-oxo-dGTP diphosphatase
VSFGGAKLALLTAGRVLVLLRDDISGIPWPGHWDLPGGGREGEESPEDCVLRELHEELSVVLTPADLHWRRSYPRLNDNPGVTWFFVSRIEGFDAAQVRLGSEGQEWRLMPVAEFLARPKVVPYLAERLAEYLAEYAAEG